MLGCTYWGDGSDSTYGNVNSVTGQSGSIADGLNYNYLYKRGPDNYVDYIGANSGTIFFKSQETAGRAVNYGGPTNSYRAIHSTFIFGALRGGSSTKNELMNVYMDYLLSAPGITELTNNCVQNLTLGPSPFNRTFNLKFTLSKPAQVKIRIYNIVGQMVRQLIDNELTQGSHRFIWKGDDNFGKELSSGSYLLRIEIDKEVINRVIVLVR